MAQKTQSVNVGVVGGGLGGLATAICLAQAGAQVTVFEAAQELGEIGAGIQMTPNVAILLHRWGVHEEVGDNLVQFEELNMRRKDGTVVGHTTVSTLETAINRPWYVVHRAHLHEGLVKVATRLGVTLLVDAAVTGLACQDAQTATVTTHGGASYTFDLVIGADGVHSTVRKALFPDVVPSPPTTNCAYRAIVPMQQIRDDPLARELVAKKTMDVWMAEKAYIITYPINAGTAFNVVIAHHRPEKLWATEPEVPLREVRDECKDFDPRIKRVVDMIDATARWPLLVTGPLKLWSSPRKNVVLIGDAAHSMTNHMAQGAASAMEDGAFLGRCVAQVVQGRLRLDEAVDIYEAARMPEAHTMQQLSFLNGAIWQLPEGPAQQARDAAMAPEVKGQYLIRSSNLYGDPRTLLQVCGYDAEAHADVELAKYLHGGREPFHADSRVTASTLEATLGWFLPDAKSNLNLQEV